MTIQEFFKKPIEEISEEDILHVANTYDWEDIEKESVFKLYTQRQQAQYLKWLDEEIIEQRRAKELKDRKHFDFHEGVEIGCIAAKEKFMELINPQSINNGNETGDTR